MSAETQPRAHRALGYAVTGLVTFLLVALIAQPWTAGSGIFDAGGDDLWVQASSQVAASVGPFGIDPNLGWPSGYALWSVPQLGIFLGILLWFLGGVLGAGSAASVLWTVAVVGGLAAMSCLFLFRSVVPTVATAHAAPLAIALGGSPAALVVVGHVNVAAWFMVPLLVGITFRMRGAPRKAGLWWGLAAVGIAVVSPLWWVIVFSLILVVMAFVGLLVREWSAVWDRLIVGAALAVALIVQILLFRGYPNLSGSESRGRWDSNLFGGHFVDFILSSPLANVHLLPFTDLAIGASAEFRPIGVIAGAMGGLLLVVVLLAAGVNKLVPGEPQDKIATLSQWSIVVLVFFVVGGFGNLQAAMAIVIGGGSPARAWSRLGLIVALFGATWLLLMVTRWLQRRQPVGREGVHKDAGAREGGSRRVEWGSIVGVAVSVAVVALYFVDARAIYQMDSVSRVAQQAEFSEYEAVRFVEAANEQSCLVLQLPVTDGLLPRSPTEAKQMAEYYYRGYIPYLMAPDFAWTYGAVSPSAISKLDAIGTSALNPADPELSPFCAVLFDKKAAAELRTEGEPLPGSEVSGLGSPDYSGDRFDVFLLPR
jgi:hypothetical protein